MALNWLWRDKYGEFVFETPNGTRVESLYKGNAPLIAIYHYEENGAPMYMVTNFFVDDDHAKRCLGLVKGFDNIFDNGRDRLVKIRIDKSRNKSVNKLLGYFIKAFDELEIELYKEAENEKAGV